MLWQIGVGDPAPGHQYPEESEHNWLQPPLLAGEVNYSYGVCRKYQDRLCPYENCTGRRICAVRGASGHTAWFCGGRRRRIRQQRV
eukprot:15467964-Alexandrium_andersonii.AAC.1